MTKAETGQGSPSRELAEEAERSLRTRMAFFLIILFSAAAYLPAALSYHMFVDEWTVLNLSLQKTCILSPLNQGAWRLLGLRIISTGLGISPVFYVLLVVVAHAVNCFLVYLILTTLNVPRMFSLLLALCLASCPCFHEAIVWASATGYVWSTAVYIGLLYTAQRLMQDRGFLPGWFLPASIAGALVGNLVWEQLAFAYFVFPLLLLLWNWGVCAPGFEGWLGKIWRSAGAVVGSLIYMGAYQITHSQASLKSWGFDFRSAFSTYYYQYVNFNAYEVWLYKPIVASAAKYTGSGTLLISGVLLVSAVVLLFKEKQRKKSVRTEIPLLDPDKRIVLSVLALLLISLSFVYVVGGGFSLDSRKRYSLILICMLAAGSVPALTGLGLKLYRSRAVAVCLMVVACVNVPTVWLLTAARNWQIEKQEALARLVADGDVPDYTFIDAYTQAGVDWSRIRRMWTDFYDPTFIHFYRADSGNQRVILASGKESACYVATWDETLHNWEIQKNDGCGHPADRGVRIRP